MYSLIDSHSHIDELDDVALAVEKARENGVVAIVAVGQEYRSNYLTMELAARYSSCLYPALGLHPAKLSTVVSLDKELHFIEDNIQRASAVGEIGLDYKKDVVKMAGKEMQKEVLRSVLELAQKYDKPVSVHSRYAWRDCFVMVRDSGVKKAVFHWYTGPSNVLEDILSKGYFVSATLAAEYYYEHKRAIRATPLEQLLLETDSPVVYRGHVSEPADVLRSLHAVAECKAVDPAIVAEKTTANGIALFGLSGLSPV